MSVCIDSFSIYQVAKLEKLLNELRETTPHIRWFTKWHNYKDENLTVYLTLRVPINQEIEAREIYDYYYGNILEDEESDENYKENNIINRLIEKVIESRNEFKWGKLQNPKDLTISLSIIANELLRKFHSKETIETNTIENDIVDLLIYSLILSHELGMDVYEAFIQKLEEY